VVAKGTLGHFSRLFVLRLSTVVARPDEVTTEVGESFRTTYNVLGVGLRDGTRVFTGRFGPYAGAPLAVQRIFGIDRRFVALPTVSDLAYVTDVDFTTPSETSGTGEIFGRCVTVGDAEVLVELYADPPVVSGFPFVILNGPTDPELVMRVSIPVRCVDSGGVAGAPPTAGDDDASTSPGTAVSVDVLANDSDPDNDLDLDSVTVLQPPANGTADKDPNGGLVYTPDPGFTGVDVFSYIVSDQQGNVSNAAQVTVTVGTVTDTPPVANDDTAATQRGAAVVIDVAANDTDADGNLDRASTVLRRGAASGQATANADGTVTYTPSAGFVGSDAFSYVIFDTTQLSSNEAEVTVSVQAPGNAAPNTIDDSAFTPQNTFVDVDVLLNDSDPERDALVNVTIATPPGSGVVQVNGRSIRYIPDRGSSGVDTFTYTVDDDAGNTSLPATVTITVGIVNGGNTPPLVVDDTATTEVDTAVTVNVLANDSDPDGSIDAASLVVSAAPASGSAAANADGTITYTPAPDFVGQDMLRYTVADDVGDRSVEAQVSITVTGVGNPPIASDDIATTTTNTPVEIFVTMNDDGNGFLLTASDLIIETPPANGSAVTGIGSILYTPDQGFTGVDTFVYSVSNALFLRDSATVTVTVNPPTNTPPVANPDMTNTTPGASITVNVVANDTDVDGSVDPTTVAVVTAPSSGTVIANSDGTVTYTPNTGFTGTDSVDYVVSDNLGAQSDPATLTITVSDLQGADMPPVDNISAAELEFLVRFGGRFVSRGLGLFLGFNHATDEALANAEQIGDYTFLFPNNASVRAVSEPYTFDTDLQSGSVEYNDAISRYQVTGFDSAPIFNPAAGTFTVRSETDPILNFSVMAPNTPILDGDDQPAIVRGDFNQLATVVQYPDTEFTHMFVRFFTGVPGVTGTRIYLSRIPKEQMMLDPASGMRFREIATERVRNRLAELNEFPAGDVAIVFYNQVDNTEIFPGPDRRPVPVAAGRGISLPGDQLVSRPTNRCDNVPVNVRCQGGPNRRLLATARDGRISIHAADDGRFIDFLVGGNVPNFLVQAGRHTVQDPASNCLLVSDTEAVLSNGLRGGVIHLYDTDGSVVQGNFIESTDGVNLGLSRPRGMAIFNGDLYVATENDGRVLRFDPQTGAFLGERVNDPDIAPRDIEFFANGDVLVSDASESAGADQILLYPQDGSSPRVIVSGLANPSQISLTNDLNFTTADFSAGQIRYFNDGAENLVSLNLGPDSNGAIRRPVGVFQLDNGNLLVAGDRDLDLSIVDPTADPNNPVVGDPVRSSSTLEYIGEACLNQ
jgi:hypothetical protein